MFRAQSTKEKVLLTSEENEQHKITVSASIASNHEIPPVLIAEIGHFLKHLKVQDYKNSISDGEQKKKSDSKSKSKI